MIGQGTRDSVRAWVVYPERRDRAPVVVVVHEIFGLTSWVRGVADQYAAEGFIAIAPDLLTDVRLPASPDSAVGADSARRAITGLDMAQIQRRLGLVAEFGMSRPAALRTYGITGFCWGGSVTLAHAATAPSALAAAVPFYGGLRPGVMIGNARAPILAMYAENDARVNASIPAIDSVLTASGRRFEREVYTGAGHGFLRQQNGANGANLSASKQAWPRAVAFFREKLR